MPNTQQFVTPESILTYTGATVAVVAISTTLRKVTGSNSIWIPFITSLVIGFVVAGASGSLNSLLEWLVAFVNCCLLFCTAIGANEFIASKSKTQELVPSKWFVSWFT
jgi:hypothetical protein